MSWDPLDPVLQTAEHGRQRAAVYFCCAANKPARVVWPKVVTLLQLDTPVSAPPLPLERLSHLRRKGYLPAMLRGLRLSPYGHVLARLVGLVSEFRLFGTGWRWEPLCAAPGFGFKTPRCIGLYGFDADVCGLDVHVRRWLTVRGHAGPPEALERAFLAEARSMNLRPWQLDRQVWLAGRRGGAS